MNDSHALNVTWNDINWTTTGTKIRRLQYRIYKAAKDNKRKGKAYSPKATPKVC